VTSNKPLNKILLKYSGEAVAGSAGQGIDPEILHFMSREIKSVVKQNVAVGVVIGGGNLFRGQELNQDGIDRVAGDHMGMLATVMNGIALRDSLERNGIKTRVMSAIPMPGIVEHYDRRRVIHLLDDGFVVIFTAGTGNPFFTTDTAACLRGIEINADVVLKATKVDGVYSDDPKTNPEAQLFDSISFDEAIQKNLKVMDTTALTLARDNDMKIKVFNYESEGALLGIVKGEDIGTLITNG
jgi:uridylate kinase|tara:strand:+ start:568 stop:1290 length:723 start_codon:yes stop_codon:yes gene_type:complete